MRRFLLCAALAVAATRPTAAETILYATAASQNRVDAYQVFNDGSLSPDPVKQHPTGGIRPRRLVARGCNLYVAERDRVEVFRIKGNGGLELIGATRQADKSRAHDIALSDDGKTLYVPIRRQKVVAAYPLDADGKPAAETATENGVPAGAPTSCVYGPVDSGGWEDIVAANGRIYVTDTSRVLVYGTDATGAVTGAAPVPYDTDGNGTIDDGETKCPAYSTVLTTAAACIDPTIVPKPKRPADSCSLTKRGNVKGGVGLAVDGTMLFLSQRFDHDVQGFTLEPDTGLFPPISGSTDPTVFPTKQQKKQERRQRKRNRTDRVIRYIGLTMFHPSADSTVLYGAGYVGRTDVYRLRDDGTLPKEPTSTTPKDVTSTPVRTAVGMTAQGRGVLYVAGGERDRIQAFRLYPEGSIDQSFGVRETNTIDGSYPNDVALADVSACP